jgi:hypothetical protein
MVTALRLKQVIYWPNFVAGRRIIFIQIAVFLQGREIRALYTVGTLLIWRSHTFCHKANQESRCITCAFITGKSLGYIGDYNPKGFFKEIFQ